MAARRKHPDARRPSLGTADLDRTPRPTRDCDRAPPATTRPQLSATGEGRGGGSSRTSDAVSAKLGKPSIFQGAAPGKSDSDQDRMSPDPASHAPTERKKVTGSTAPPR